MRVSVGGRGRMREGWFQVLVRSRAWPAEASNVFCSLVAMLQARVTRMPAGSAILLRLPTSQLGLACARSNPRPGMRRRRNQVE
jgi:hypothetical protein